MPPCIYDSKKQFHLSLDALQYLEDLFVLIFFKLTFVTFSRIISYFTPSNTFTSYVVTLKITLAIGRTMKCTVLTISVILTGLKRNHKT